MYIYIYVYVNREFTPRLFRVLNVRKLEQAIQPSKKTMASLSLLLRVLHYCDHQTGKARCKTCSLFKPSKLHVQSWALILIIK